MIYSTNTHLGELLPVDNIIRIICGDATVTEKCFDRNREIHTSCISLFSWSMSTRWTLNQLTTRKYHTEGGQTLTHNFVFQRGELVFIKLSMPNRQKLPAQSLRQQLPAESGRFDKQGKVLQNKSKWRVLLVCEKSSMKNSIWVNAHKYCELACTTLHSD